ncbi:MAG: tetratricopeptide repeat protein [Acidobacteria bacterium]|nr:tetratricopeptide repeat protein [Acidobacteriota bacterium]
MLHTQLMHMARRGALLCLVLAALLLPISSYAQTSDTLPAMKQKVDELLKAQRYTEALPMLEKIVAAEPDNSQMRFFLGFSLLAQASTVKDPLARKALRVRAREAFLKSKELGNKEELVEALIQSIPPDGADGRAFSSNPQANELMTEGESLFSQGKLDEALKNYQQALELDPKIYEAALFCGDVYTQRGDFAQAEIWYQKAIAIDPNRETAYRYSATPLMRQEKKELARDRYIEAYISEPYNRYSAVGLTQWAQVTNTTIAHPNIEIPSSVTFDEKGDAKINFDAKLIGGTEDGTFAWLSYSIARVKWHKETFAKTFPNEKTYRHSLVEEAEALRSVLTAAMTDKRTKTLHSALAKLKKLNDDGLLEAYILLARPDQGIAADYPAYLKQNRDKLRRYMVEYVLTGGGR